MYNNLLPQFIHLLKRFTKIITVNANIHFGSKYIVVIYRTGQRCFKYIVAFYRIGQRCFKYIVAIYRTGRRCFKYIVAIYGTG